MNEKMTDKERAEDYYIEDFEELFGFVKDRVTHAYIAGLAKGGNLGKEKQWLATEKAQKKTSARIKELEKEIDYYKSRESHLDEVEEDAKAIAKENAGLKTELMHLKGCEQCKDRPKGEVATVCPTEYENHCIGQKMTYIKELEEENEKLKHKLGQFEKGNKVLTNIIIDVFKLNVDLCTLCKSKGEDLPYCECLTDESCLKKLIGLYEK